MKSRFFLVAFIALAVLRITDFAAAQTSFYHGKTVRIVVRALREAYAKARKDPELVGEAKHGNLEIEPGTGEELQALTERVISQPREVIERVKKLVGN
jgi:hypothetical protein